MNALSSLLARCEGNQPVGGGIPYKRVSDAELCFFLSFSLGVEQSDELPLILKAIILTGRHYYGSVHLSLYRNGKSTSWRFFVTPLCAFTN